jgi:hypothetical protein
MVGSSRLQWAIRMSGRANEFAAGTATREGRPNDS